MSSIQDFYIGLREHARTAKTKAALVFLDRQGKNKLQEVSGPYISSSYRKEAVQEYKKTKKLIRSRMRNVQ